MIEDILFLRDEMAQLVCAAWAHTQDPKEIAVITKMNDEKVVAEIERLKKLGILKEGGKLEGDAEKYIKTVAAQMVKDIKG